MQESSTAIPPPTVPCSEDSGDDPEFHSLRPYQASPCQTTMAPTAKFCGNDLIFHDTITKEYPGEGTCEDDGVQVVCTYNEIVDKKLIISLSDAELPIMGNTEDVVNSLNPFKGSREESETLTDLEKVNGYVSWYLNGVSNRAEYPPLDLGDPVDTNRIVDLSGPLNKLLPQDIQFVEKINTINDAHASVDNNAGIRHNQIVGCTLKIETASLLGLIGDLIGKGRISIIDVPFPCYHSWLVELATHLPTVDIVERRLTDWTENEFPPLISDPSYADYADYFAAYQRWRGKSCAVITLPDIIPLVGGKKLVLCAENPLKENFYSQLFPYIPLSSTEDLKGSIAIDNVSSSTSPSTGGVAVSNVTFSNQTPSDLFFPHMQESTELAELLQKTFVSSSESGNIKGAPTNVSPPASCTTVDVRTNNGDKLFATDITGDLHYEATFTCTFDSINTCSGYCIVDQMDCGLNNGVAGVGDCNGGRFCCDIPGSTPTLPEPQSCTKDVYISLSTTSSTPEVDNIWSQLVAGPQSIFKRIFPKTNSGGIGQIIDIPGSTNISYSGPGISQSTTDLKFPHIGGISEYFLKGIQTALRPKGYGEPISFNPGTSSTNTDPGNCVFDMNAINAGMQAAAAKYNLPVSLLRAIFEIESFPWIIDPSSYVCQEFGGVNGSTSVGIAAVTNPTYNWVTCAEERMSDVGMCGDYPGKLSRCNFEDSFELMARVLLANNGKYMACTGQLGTLDMSWGGDWYISACRYYGLLADIQIPNGIMPESEKRQDGGMLYCDFVGWKLGLFPPYPPKPTTLTP